MVFEDCNLVEPLNYRDFKEKVEARLGIAPGTLPENSKQLLRELLLEEVKKEELDEKTRETNSPVQRTAASIIQVRVGMVCVAECELVAVTVRS